MANFNKRLLKEIAHLRYLQTIEGMEMSRIVPSLEILRFVRNDELGLTFEQGKLEEDGFIETTYKESDYSNVDRNGKKVGS